MNTTKNIALSYSSFVRTQVVMIKELVITLFNEGKDIDY